MNKVVYNISIFGLVTLLILGGFSIYFPIETTNATTIETPLDETFIYEVLSDLTSYADNGTYLKGRCFGTAGEHASSIFLKQCWDGNISYGNPLISDSTRQKLGDWQSRKTEIDSFSLEISGFGEIGQTEIFPIWSSSYDEVNISEAELHLCSDELYDLLNGVEESDEGNDDQSDSFSMDLTGSMTLSDAILVEIDDYDSAPLNQTNNTIHLVGMNNIESEDSFSIMQKDVADSGAAGCILVTSNPSFLSTQSLSLPIVAVTPYAGERIRHMFSINNSVIVSLHSNRFSGESDELETESTEFEAYQEPENGSGGSYHIYLLDLSRLTNCDIRGLKSIVTKTVNHIGGQNVDGLLISDWSDDAHFMADGSYKRPCMTIDGDLGQSLTSLLEQNQSLTVNMTMSTSDVVVDSYNVIGEIPGEITSSYVVCCGHYDGWWGQAAMDNAVAPASVMGIAKWFADNDITPKYTIQFVCFGGEEYGRWGSRHYVNQLRGKKDVEAVINMDTFAQNYSHSLLPFTPWMHCSSDETFNQAWSVMNITNYAGNFVDFDVLPYPDDPKIKRTDICQWTDTESFKYMLPCNRDNIITLERWPYPEIDHPDELAFYDHRSGESHTAGDVLTKIDTEDLYSIAEMALNLTKFFSCDATHTINDIDLNITTLDSNNNNDSIILQYNITTNLSSWGILKAHLKENGVARRTVSTELMTIPMDDDLTGSLTISLPPDQNTTSYQLNVVLVDYRGNVDDQYNTTISLTPLNNSVADFSWQRSGVNRRRFTFTDQSLPSTGANLTNRTWNFGDGNTSYQVNPTHTYRNRSGFNVTLTVRDSANTTDSVTYYVQALNTYPEVNVSQSVSVCLTNSNVTYNSSSVDVDGTISNYTWNLGDLNFSYSRNVTHSYNESGQYSVSLRIEDDDGAVSYERWSQTLLVADILVDDDFTDSPSNHQWSTIQKALDNASVGDLIYVYNGTYDAFTINTDNVTIVGMDESNTWTKAASGFHIVVNASNVSISHLNLYDGVNGISIECSASRMAYNVELSNIIIEDLSGIGVYISGSHNNTMTNLQVNDTNIGVYLKNTTFNVLTESNISYCSEGVFISDDSTYNWVGNPDIFTWYPDDIRLFNNTIGILVDESSYNYILGCIVNDSAEYGVRLDDSSNNTISTCLVHTNEDGMLIKDSSYNKVSFVKLINNSVGLELYGDSSNNLIQQNNMSNNSEYGISIPVNCYSNLLSYNDFFDNGDGLRAQCKDDHQTLMGTPDNDWNKTSTTLLTINGKLVGGEGNYWSDYTGSDAKGDGVGDTSYEISRLLGHYDDYPVMESYGWCSGDGWSID